MHSDHQPPGKQGLYDPRHEHDACGLGFIAHIKGKKSHAIIAQALQILKNLTHRGATGADPLQGDGAGILIHGTDDPGSIGRRVSHGCIRLPNRMLKKLYRAARVGTDVFVYHSKQPEEAQR